MCQSNYYLLCFGFQMREFREEADLIQMQIKEEGFEQPPLGGEAPRVIPVMHYHSNSLIIKKTCLCCNSRKYFFLKCFTRLYGKAHNFSKMQTNVTVRTRTLL